MLEMHPKDEEKSLKQRFLSCVDADLWQSGACYYADLEGTGTMAYRSWKHVLTSTGGNESDTSKLYKEAVGRVETQARAVYVEEDTSSTKDEFVRVMTEQGCFILQVALCSLSGPKPLGYPPDDPFFGANRWNKEQIRCWVTSIFSAKKQIPLIVLKVLMKQRFFQNVLKLGKWKRPNDLARMALYDFMVQPMLDDPMNNQGNSMRRVLGFCNKRSHWHQEQPTTPLHALWLLVAGLGSHGTNHIEEDGGDPYRTLSTVRSAKELQAAGIIFNSEEGMGTRQIKFKQKMLEAHLYLPCIYMERNTIALFQNLILYEAAVDLDKNRCEVSAYLSFMKDLIRSHDDVKVLVTQGIIDIDPEYEEQLPFILSELQPLEVGNSHNLGTIRRQIRRYVKPSTRRKVMYLAVIGIVLTLVQTLYTVLSYHHPLH